MEKWTTNFCEFLEESGLARFCKTEEDLKVRLYHDLGIYGDIAESYIELLADNYGVDISSFCFEDYFPAEYPGETKFKKYLYTFFPFLASRYNATRSYQELTFGTLQKAMEQKTLLVQ